MSEINNSTVDELIFNLNTDEQPGSKIVEKSILKIISKEQRKIHIRMVVDQGETI